MQQLSKLTIAAAIALAALTLSTAANAQSMYLIGAQVYRSNANGTITTGDTFSYDTNTNSVGTALQLSLNSVGYGKNIAIPLLTGSNAFTITSGGFSPGSFAGLTLYFGPNATPYNPVVPVLTTTHLTVVNTVGTASFAVPSAGTQVQSYVNPGSTLTATGASIFNVGNGFQATVSQVNIANNSTGTFTIGVAPVVVPEAGTLALLVPALGVLGAVVIRRRIAR